MVTGSRDWRDVDVIRGALAGRGHGQDYRLIHGCASGADAIARSISLSLGWAKPEDWWPEYDRLPFAEANKRRNIAMVNSLPVVVLAFPTRGSRGTWHAVNYAKQRGYNEGETLFIYSEQSEVRRSKTLHEYPAEAS